VILSLVPSVGVMGCWDIKKILIPVCLCILKIFLKKLNFYFIFFFASNYFFVFSNRFDVLISKIILKK
jgi:hypothetical protein